MQIVRPSGNNCGIPADDAYLCERRMGLALDSCCWESLGWNGIRQPHVLPQFLPVLEDARLVREFRCPMQRLLRSRKIIQLDGTFPNPSPGVPFLRILLRDLLKDRHRLTASAVICQT